MRYVTNEFQFTEGDTENQSSDHPGRSIAEKSLKNPFTFGFSNDSRSVQGHITDIMPWCTLQ